jgi:hypothetical protein
MRPQLFLLLGVLATTPALVPELPSRGEIRPYVVDWPDDDGTTRRVEFRPAYLTSFFEPRHTYRVSEADGFVDILLSAQLGVSDRPVVLDYRVVPGTADLADVGHSRGHVMFDPSEYEKIVRIPIVQDRHPEMRESFTVVFSSVFSGIDVDAEPVHVDIDDDDPVRITMEDTIVYESDRGAACRIRLSEPCTNTVRFYFRTDDGTARAFHDYGSLGCEVILRPGQTAFQIPINIREDDEVEGDEAFSFHLSTPDAGCIFERVRARCVIKDGKRPPKTSVPPATPYST